MDIIGHLSNLLIKIGIPDYLARVEFSAHVGWSMCAVLASILFTPWIMLGWLIFVLYDEFYCDGHWIILIRADTSINDLYWDLISKLSLPLVYTIITACRAIWGQ